MKVSEIYDKVNAFAPFDTCIEGDNVGLLFGDKNAEVSGIVLSLDADMSALQRAVDEGCNLIVCHHPFFFDGENSVNADTPYGRKLLFAGAHRLNIISAHTNLDSCAGGINDTLGALLKFETRDRFSPTQNGGMLGRIGTPGFADIPAFAEYAKKVLHTTPRFCINNEFKNVAWVSGSGFSCINEAYKAGADTLVTGDCKYYNFTYAEELGMNLIDLGHFETEQIIVPVLHELVRTDGVKTVEHIHGSIVQTI